MLTKLIASSVISFAFLSAASHGLLTSINSYTDVLKEAYVQVCDVSSQTHKYQLRAAAVEKCQVRYFSEVEAQFAPVRQLLISLDILS